MKFSVIVPVYNRPGEVADLLASLAAQTSKCFEVVIVEDGSTEPCREVVERFATDVDVAYYYKENEGRSPARNYGIERSTGDWLVFFDSDCVIPPDYFARLSEIVGDGAGFDCFGGPDAAHESFTITQKAINHAMTSLLTTGGIRGRKRSMERFVPRTFNMGFTRRVYDRVGGFREMFSEDIDMSKRIEAAGFSTTLLPDQAVWHRRRVDFRRFFRQVHVFGMSRITLHLLYPGSLRLVHALPAVAVVLGVASVVLGIVVSPWFLLPAGLYLVAIFIDALLSARSLPVALAAVPASVIQIAGYGSGFLRAWTSKILLGRGRDINQEIAMRKGR